jgi:hypothetical protein
LGPHPEAPNSRRVWRISLSHYHNAPVWGTKCFRDLGGCLNFICISFCTRDPNGGQDSPSWMGNQGSVWLKLTPNHPLQQNCRWNRCCPDIKRDAHREPRTEPLKGQMPVLAAVPALVGVSHGDKSSLYLTCLGQESREGLNETTLLRCP